MHSVWGHNAMLLHFVATGLLFFAPLVGADPLPVGGSPARRLGEAFAGTPLHALFGLIILTAHRPVVAFFEHPAPGWRIRLLPDQSLAGSIAWAASEAATVLVMAIVLVQWGRRGSTGLDRPGLTARARSGSAPG
jgi:putative copper resistance protein D